MNENMLVKILCGHKTMTTARILSPSGLDTVGGAGLAGRSMVNKI
jgi:hypothetical protein